MRVLVTGASGFIGRALCAAAPEFDVVRAGRRVSEVCDVAFDLLDAASMEAMIRTVRPDVVVHLAGVSSPAAVRADLVAAHAANVEATAALAMALHRQSPCAHFVFASSGLTYGASFFDTPAPLPESAPLKPLDPYAATKAAAELALEPAIEAGADVTILRFFNVIGPGQSAAFALPAFARKIAAIARGEREPVLETGRLDEARDFVDVGDAVRAIVGVVAATGAGEKKTGARTFNVATGRATPMRTALEMMIASSPAAITVREGKGEGRPVIASGAADALHAATGWRAETPLQATLDRLLAEHRATP